MKSTSKLVSTTLVAALLLGACSSGESADPAAQPTTTTTVAQATTPDTTMADMTDMTEDTTPDMTDMMMDVNVFADLQVAAETVGNNGNAKALSAGIVEAVGLDGSIDDPAVQTYVELSTLLQEHVYLAGIAINTGLTAGLDSDAFVQAAGVLDGNSVEIADLIGAVAPDQRDAFLKLWRAHIGFFVDYAAASATGDTAGQEAAELALGSYAFTAGSFFESLTGGELPAADLETALNGHIDSVIAVIDAAVAGDSDIFAKLTMAADHVGAQGGAKAIAAAVVAATGMEGSVDSGAAQVYATLSTLLEEHVYLAGIAVDTAYAAGLDSDAFSAAAGALDGNSVELSELIGSIAPDDEAAFLDLWRQHIGFFVDYALGAIAGDQAIIDQALLDLGAYGGAAGAFFAAISGGVIPAAAVETGLNMHIDTLGKAIESLAKVYTG